jgi:hypothetical protein
MFCRSGHVHDGRLLWDLEAAIKLILISALAVVHTGSIGVMLTLPQLRLRAAYPIGCYPMVPLTLLEGGIPADDLATFDANDMSSIAFSARVIANSPTTTATPALLATTDAGETSCAPASAIADAAR